MSMFPLRPFLKSSFRAAARARLTLVLAVAGALALASAAPASAASQPTQAAPPGPSVKVIDSAGEIYDPAWFRAAYAAGFRLYVMHSTAWGTCLPWERTQEQLRMALEAGLKIAVYTRDPQCWQGGIEAAGPYRNRLQFFALDVEHGGVGVTRAMVDGVKSMGVRPVIYTGWAMWPALQGASSYDFADVPLWDSNTSFLDYATWTANHYAPPAMAYGGWNTAANYRVGVQQQFDFNFYGVLVDLNSFNANFLTVP